MPELPNAKLHGHPAKEIGYQGAAAWERGPGSASGRPVRPRGPQPAYAELHCKTNFSFLRGASHPEELAESAAILGYRGLAVTDRNTLAGVVRMHLAAKRCGIKLVIGAEIVPVDASPVVLLAPDRAAYGRLSRLITVGRRRSIKGDCRITFDDVASHSAGLIGLCLPGAGDDWGARSCSSQSPTRRADGAPVELGTGPRSGWSPTRGADGAPEAEASPAAWLHRYREVFGDRGYLAAELCYGRDDAGRLGALQALSGATGLPLVAANDVHYHVPDRRYLHDVLTCVRHQCTIHEAGRRLAANAGRHLHSPEEVYRRFAACREAVGRSVEILDRCQFLLDELRYEYPRETCPDGMSPRAYLDKLTWAGARERYGGRIPAHVCKMLRHELGLIGELGYEPYFLTVYDAVRFARERGILCQGRGSAANSVVCYCLGITAVDPVRVDLLFERFVSRERNEPPDIDVDFEHERREEVFQYIYEKYGRDRAAIAGEVITYRPRSAVRDVGKAMGLSLDAVDTLAKRLDWWNRSPLDAEIVREAGFDPRDRTLRMVLKLVHQLIGFPRHLSQHVGGFVMTEGPLCETAPILNGAMPDRTFIEWDKDDLDALGMLKVDCLALGMLTCIRKAFGLIAEGGGPALALHTAPPEDPAVYDMICAADTVGVFQIESRAQMSMLPRLRPRNYYDLVIEVAIVRPGPIQGGMVRPYLRRRSGEEPLAFPSEAVRGVLGKTLGVPIFQEQAMRLAIVAAGFTPDEADQLRRAMAAWKRHGGLERFQSRLIEGMKANGYDDEFAERCFKQILGFGEYGFPESHAASFALLVYVSAWLKRYYPAAFAAALVNSQPMGFYAPAQIIRDAREHGVDVLGPDVNASDYDCVLEDGAIRLGFRLIRGISAGKVEGIVSARGAGAYRSVGEVSRRGGVSRETLARLAAADAFGSLGLNRRESLWRVLSLDDEPGLFAGLEPDEPEATLPAMGLEERVVQDYDTIGMSLAAHPISLVRGELRGLGVSENGALKSWRSGRRIAVSGLVLVRQRPSTAKGVVFMTLEDETGVANLIIRPRVWERWRRAARTSVAVIAHGVVERQGEVVHVMVNRVAGLGESLVAVSSQSRDFH